MNPADQISRLQTLLERVQKRGREPRVARAAVAVVTSEPAVELDQHAFDEPTMVSETSRDLDARSTGLDAAAAVKIEAAKPEVLEPAKPEVLEPAKPEVLEPAKPEVLEPAKPEVLEPARLEAVEPEPKPEVLPEVAAPAAERVTAIKPVSAAVADDAPELEFDEMPELGEMEEVGPGTATEPTPLPAEAIEEQPPASSKRPTAAAQQELDALREQAEEFSPPPQTPPPESGPQEVVLSQLADSGIQEIEVDFTPKKVEEHAEATMEQVGQTVELDKPTEHLLELAPPAGPPVLSVAVGASDMEAELPVSIAPGLFSADLQSESERAPADAQEDKRPAAEEKQLEVAPAAAAAEVAQVAKPIEVITAVQIVAGASPLATTESKEAEPVRITVEVHPSVAAGAGGIAATDAAAFLGAVRTFQPSGFVELLDASLSLLVDP